MLRIFRPRYAADRYRTKITAFPLLVVWPGPRKITIAVDHWSSRAPTTSLSPLLEAPIVPIAAPARPHLRWPSWSPSGPIRSHVTAVTSIINFWGCPLLVGFYTHELVPSLCVERESEEGMSRYW